MADQEKNEKSGKGRMSDQEKKEIKRKWSPAGRYWYTGHYEVKREKKPDGTVVEKVEYTGPLLIAEHDAHTYKMFRKFALTAALVLFAAGIFLLTIKGFAVYRGGLYALIPATMALFPDLYLVRGALKLPVSDRRLQEDVWRQAHVRIRKSCIGASVLYGLTLILTAIFLIISKVEVSAADGLYLLLVVMPIGIAFMMISRLKGLKYRNA